MIEEAMKALWVKASTHKKLKDIARKQSIELKELVATLIENYLNEKK
jgi:hypothetical protein